MYHCITASSHVELGIRQDHRISRAEFSKGASREWVDAVVPYRKKNGFVWRNCSEIQWLIVDALF